MFVGNENDYENKVKYQLNLDWSVVHACKEPYHREALQYKEKGAPKDHPEYSFAIREERLILNLVDAPNPSFFSKNIVDKSLSFIKEKLQINRNILVHCNQGMSRSAGIAFLFLLQKGEIPESNFIDAEKHFKKLYPPCNFGLGVRGFISENFGVYKPK